MEFRCLCLCEEAEEVALRKGAEQFARKTRRSVVPEWYRQREDLLYRIINGAACDAAVVALPGALGMEAVLGVREKMPTIPLVWCSDDDMFALQSYRLQVTEFLRLPINEAQAADAFSRCAEKQNETWENSP